MWNPIICAWECDKYPNNWAKVFADNLVTCEEKTLNKTSSSYKEIYYLLPF